jgi:hypothetical protein
MRKFTSPRVICFMVSKITVVVVSSNQFIAERGALPTITLLLDCRHHLGLVRSLHRIIARARLIPSLILSLFTIARRKESCVDKRAFWMRNCSDLVGFRFEGVPVSHANSGKAEAFPRRLSTVHQRFTFESLIHIRLV